jgi:glycosyltransferase involved in cell wall biosynthesis
MALRLKPAIIHVHDPELLWVSWLVRLFGVQFIYDVHEHVPKQITSKPWINPPILRKPVAAVVEAYEWFFTLFANRVISVTPEIVGRFPEKKGLLVRNFPPLETAVMPIIHSDKRETVSIYAGGLTHIRGIAEIVKAYSELGKDFRLHLLGPWESETFRDECLSRAGENVRYLGQVSPDEVSRYIRQADIGLAILYPVKNYLMSYPVKAFEYMKEGLPIVMSSFPYWKNLFSSCAEFVNPYDSEEIKAAVIELAGSSSKRNEFGRNGYDLIRKEYNWTHEGEKLKEAYLSLLE